MSGRVGLHLVTQHEVRGPVARTYFCIDHHIYHLKYYGQVEQITQLTPCQMIISTTQAALLFSAVSTLVVAAGAFLAYRQIKSAHDWNRRKAAYDLLFQSFMGEFKNLRHRFESKVDIYDNDRTIDDFAPYLSSEDYMMLDSILNFMDALCLASKNHVMDAEMIYSSMAGLVCTYRRWAEPYILRERARISPLLWIEIDPFAREWGKRIQETTDKLIDPGKSPL